MKNLLFLFTAILAANIISAQNWNPRHPSWTDSHAANGFCWCNTTNFDHNLDSKSLRINNRNYNIVDVCDELESHPSYRAFRNGDAPYNDIQCGHGPANDAADETGCPGRTDLGPGGCDNIGPTYDMDWLESRSRFGGNGDTTSTPTTGSGTIVHIRKRNASGFAIDGDRGGANGQNLYLWGQNSNNVNQRWIEIDRGNGYYTYQKENTNFCIDGNRGGDNGQNVYLWTCSTNNQNQHWKKVSTAGGTYRLEKRNSPSHSLDGGNGGDNGQNVYLWGSNSNNQNQQWIINAVGSAKSIASLASNSDLSIFPNPVEFSATISIDSDEVLDNVTYTVSNLSGQVVASGSSSNATQILDMANLSSGVYLIEARTGTKKYVKKVVKK